MRKLASCYLNQEEASGEEIKLVWACSFGDVQPRNGWPERLSSDEGRMPHDKSASRETQDALTLLHPMWGL